MVGKQAAGAYHGVIPNYYKENVTMNEQKTELLDERSKEKMKRARKFEKRIKSKKKGKDYKTLSK